MGKLSGLLKHVFADRITTYRKKIKNNKMANIAKLLSPLLVGQVLPCSAVFLPVLPFGNLPTYKRTLMTPWDTRTGAILF